MKKFIISLILGICSFILPASVMAQQTYLYYNLGSYSLSAGGTAQVSWGGGDTMPSYGDTFVWCVNGIPVSAVSGIPGSTFAGSDYLSVSDISNAILYTTGFSTGEAYVTIEYYNEDLEVEDYFTTQSIIFITS